MTFSLSTYIIYKMSKYHYVYIDSFGQEHSLLARRATCSCQGMRRLTEATAPHSSVSVQQCCLHSSQTPLHYSQSSTASTLQQDVSHSKTQNRSWVPERENAFPTVISSLQSTATVTITNSRFIQKSHRKKRQKTLSAFKATTQAQTYP